MISVPIGITYDGHIYIDLASVLGSSRFPADWHRARTPLFPLSLKLSFWAFGQQALAAIFVNSVAATAGILITAHWVKRLAGSAAGALTSILLSLFPTLVAYGHLVLTEAGTFALLTWLLSVSLLQRAPNSALAWRKTAVLSLLLIAGYYWRPNLLVLAPLLAILHLIGCRHAEREQAARGLWTPRVQMTCQTVLIVILPYTAVQPWRSYMQEKRLMAIMLKSGIVRQALPPPEDPLVKRDPDGYRSAIEASKYHDNLYSGLREDFCKRLASEVFAWPAPEQITRLLAQLAITYPKRYLTGVARTFMLFFGAEALVNETNIYRGQILSPTFTGSKIAEGPPGLEALNREHFSQRLGSSAVLRILNFLAPFYDTFLSLCFGIIFLGAVVALFFRDLRLFTICIVPFYYIAQYALALTSVDRYAMPVYPIVLAAAVVACSRIVRRTLALIPESGSESPKGRSQFDQQRRLEPTESPNAKPS